MNDPTKTGPYSGVLKIFDRPLTRDWIFWLFAVIVVSSGADNLASFGSGESIDPLAGLIDGAISVGINYVIFGVVPSNIRAQIRKRRSPKLEQSINRAQISQSFTPPSSDSEDLMTKGERVKAPNRSRTFTRLALIALAILIILFAQGNWEYRKLLSDIENGESVLTTYNSKSGILSDVFKNVQTPLSDYDRERVKIAIQKWESLARESSDQLAIWQTEISSSIQAPWNKPTSRNRQEILMHYGAWAEKLDATEADLFNSRDVVYRANITSTFMLYCTDAKNWQSFFAWPSSQISGKKRVEEICKN